MFAVNKFNTNFNTKYRKELKVRYRRSFVKKKFSERSTWKTNFVPLKMENLSLGNPIRIFINLALKSILCLVVELHDESSLLNVQWREPNNQLETSSCRTITIINIRITTNCLFTNTFWTASKLKELEDFFVLLRMLNIICLKRSQSPHSVKNQEKNSWKIATFTRLNYGVPREITNSTFTR